MLLPDNDSNATGSFIITKPYSTWRFAHNNSPNAVVLKLTTMAPDKPPIYNFKLNVTSPRNKLQFNCKHFICAITLWNAQNVVTKSHIRFPNSVAGPEWLSFAKPWFRVANNCQNREWLRTQKGDRLRYEVREWRVTYTSERLRKYEEPLVAGWQKHSWPTRYAELRVNTEMWVPKLGTDSKMAT